MSKKSIMQRRRERMREAEKPTSSGKARNPFAFLASQAHKQNRALLNLTSKKPATSAPEPKREPAHSKTVSVGRLVIAGSIAEKIGGANR